MTDLTLITFLGTANYKETTYKYKDEECKTNLFPVALSKFLRPSKVFVVITKEAKDKWLDLLRQGLEKLESQDIEMSYIDIPDGHSEEDLWNIFTAIASKIERGNRVVFDITHSFRTLPFLSFLAISYLRVAKQVEIAGIYYGAWEARKPQPPKDTPMQSCPEDISPVFDLTPFVTLLDWTSATDQFLKTGNSIALANLIQGEKENNLTDLAKNLKEVSNGLELLRPIKIMETASKLPELIKEAKPSLTQLQEPFSLLLKKIEADYGKFALDGLLDESGNLIDFKKQKEFLEKLLLVAQWYFEKGYYVHTLSTLREWLPSLLCYHFKVNIFDKDERSDMELLLSGGTDKDRATKEVIRKSPRCEEWNKFSKSKNCKTIWSDNLAKLRNDVLHSGFRKEPKDTNEIIELTKRHLEKIKSIAHEWGITE
ncbi:MAG: TIGR02221 family CRISPR-associated protein [Blastocatellia bacterium]|nr:TIGR02221 family CRISPR-associated protein [Blastocatellia bacterium]